MKNDCLSFEKRTSTRVKSTHARHETVKEQSITQSRDKAHTKKISRCYSEFDCKGVKMKNPLETFAKKIRDSGLLYLADMYS